MQIIMQVMLRKVGLEVNERTSSVLSSASELETLVGLITTWLCSIRNINHFEVIRVRKCRRLKGSYLN